jgi:transposase
MFSRPPVDAIGPILAARIVGRAANATCFPTTWAFASDAGVAPIQVASGYQARHRLSRSGDRLLNCALHLVAVAQVRMLHCAGRVYYHATRAAGGAWAVV